LEYKETMTTDIREFIKSVHDLAQRNSSMRVRERKNQDAETILIPKVRSCGTTETMIMPVVRMEDEVLPGDNTTSYPNKAIAVVHAYIVSGYPPNPDYSDAVQPYVVWFAKTLQNWKALVGVPLLDGKYYEVTYNGDEDVIYLDVYQKVENLCIGGELFK
jgi:hypothetical protein